MSPRSIKIQNFFFGLLLALALTAMIFQMRQTHWYYNDIEQAVEDAYDHDTSPHPILIWRTKFHTLYVLGLHQILKSPHQKFWLVSQDLDVMMMMNYFAYPKELRTSLETQMELEKRHYEEDFQPFTQLPPQAEYEETIYTHFRESSFD